MRSLLALLFELLVFWWHRLWARLFRRTLYVEQGPCRVAPSRGDREFPFKTLAQLDRYTQAQWQRLRVDLRIVLRGDFGNETLRLRVNPEPWVVVTIEGAEGFWDLRRRLREIRRHNFTTRPPVALGGLYVDGGRAFLVRHDSPLAIGRIICGPART